ncbi:hypothetical protein AGMMS50296_8330 [Alphaproteobacteria bacterium]|nr:hypothetical protein AGMMS50296_8330 [Alphaproteobacteria bacterium]
MLAATQQKSPSFQGRAWEGDEASARLRKLGLGGINEWGAAQLN